MGRKYVSWKTLLREEIISTPWMSLYHDQFEMPNGKKGNYFYMHTRGSALTIPVTDDGNILLVRQYRYLTGDTSIELPCGGIKQGQSEEEAARAELVEETGFECTKLRKAGRFIPYNGLSDEFCTVYIARQLNFVGTKPDETEQIEVMTVAPDEVKAMIQKGKILDGMTIAGWLLGCRYL
jgi:ADP-ribose pyrophosphatase